jgi:hypothetical protein
MADKHTPGPWRWCDTSVYGDPLTGPNKDCLIGPDKDPSRKPYASDSADHILYLDSPITAENSANARLIAAAPDLLEALQKIAEITEPDSQVWRIAKAAIRKAE